MGPGFSNGCNLREGRTSEVTEGGTTLLHGSLVGDRRGKLWLRSVDPAWAGSPALITTYYGGMSLQKL